MKAIRRHYDRVAGELTPRRRSTACCPRATTRSCWSSKLHMPTLRALAYARATRPDVLEAVTVNVDDADTRRLVRGVGASARSRCRSRWSSRPTGRSPSRCSTTSSGSAPTNPRDIVTVFIPEYVVGHWWEQLLHNQSALRLKGRLLFQPGVMVTSVPWQLKSSERVVERRADPARRRGYPSRRGTTGPPPRRRPRHGSRGRGQAGRQEAGRHEIDGRNPGRTMTTTVPTEVLDWTDRVLDLHVGAGCTRRALRRPGAGRRRT